MSSCMRLGSGLRTRSASLTVSRGVSSPRGRELSEVGCGRSYMRCKPHPCLLTCDVSAYSARAACARGHEARVAVVVRQRHTVHRLQVCSSRLACDSTVQLEDCGDVGLHQSTTSNRARAAGAWVYFLARVRAVATRQQRAAPRLRAYESLCMPHAQAASSARAYSARLQTYRDESYGAKTAGVWVCVMARVQAVAVCQHRTSQRL